VVAAFGFVDSVKSSSRTLLLLTMVLFWSPMNLVLREIFLLPLLRLILMMSHCPRSMEGLGMGEHKICMMCCLSYVLQ